MKKLPIKLTLLVFTLALLSGFYLRIPFMDNLIRSFFIYVIFSVLILLVYLLQNQSAYNLLKSELSKKQEMAQQEEAELESGETTTNS